MDDSLAYCGFFIPSEKEPTLREQEIQFIQQNGIDAFCKALILSALLKDPEYLSAHLIFLNKS
jgi:hypothetical protein